MLYLFPEPVGAVVKYNTKGEITMTELERLYRRFEYGYITTEEFEKQLDRYECRLLEKYINNEITLEELRKRIDR
jgi:hypothetical protein